MQLIRMALRQFMEVFLPMVAPFSSQIIMGLMIRASAQVLMQHLLQSLPTARLPL